MEKPRVKALGFFFLAIFLLWLLLPKPDLIEQIDFSQSIYDNSGELLRLTISEDEKYRHFVPLSRISSTIIETTLLHEDKFFYIHPGFNPVSIVQAFINTYILKTRRVGGSTITMQLARIRYKLYTKSISGKILQILKSIQIERHYSKDEILEAYLNLTPYGRNIEGIGAASLIYFKKHPEKLTLHEALTLAIIPQSPKKRTPLTTIDLDNSELINARKKLALRWVNKHEEDINKVDTLTLPLITNTPADIPFAAPHLTDFLIKKNPSKVRLDSTINLEMQRMVERIAKSYIEKNIIKGLDNTTVMISDFTTMEVNALLGSVDFHNNNILGQVNGTQGKRSPGSTLKPFIYALAMDQGLIHPQTMLKDSPKNFGAFNPENFDNDFVGPIKATDALIRSRNIPAISLSNKLQNPSLHEFLLSTNVTNLKSEDHYGLALALGGAELTMEELVRLYSLLANKGIYKSLRYLKDTPTSTGKRLLTEEASILTLNILKDNPRPDRMSIKRFTEDSTPIYWKTGTSQGFRDAWTIGIIGNHIIAVWVGNFAGPGDPAYVGATAAAPLFFELADALKNDFPSTNYLHQYEIENIKLVEVCSVSGHLPSKHCTSTNKTLFIPGVSPISKCEIHREVIIDELTSLRSCGGTSKKIRKEVFEFWPSDLLKIFKNAGVPRRVPPKYNKNCDQDNLTLEGLDPQITSPMSEVVYTIRLVDENHNGDRNKIPFTAVTDGDITNVYWFIDDSFAGKSTSDETFFWNAKSGKFVIRAIDDSGRFDSKKFTVEVVN